MLIYLHIDANIFAIDTNLFEIDTNLVEINCIYLP